jgi:hypothetical protein
LGNQSMAGTDSPLPSGAGLLFSVPHEWSSRKGKERSDEVAARSDDDDVDPANDRGIRHLDAGLRRPLG